MLLSPQHARFGDQQEMLLTIPPKTGNPQYTLQDQGIFDSGCSRHMTGNKSFLTDYQEIDGGFVAFGGSPKGGKITEKGKIRTGKLDFEDVYFVKELKFNLFSVSQMCDKKNSVLFTETECLVLSPDFKLLDESQVLLKVPRQNNMYSFDLKNVVPSGGKPCWSCLQSSLKMTILVLLVRRESNTKLLFCGMKGVKREFSVARTPQQNGVAKRKNRTLIEAVRTMLAYSLLPTTFWAEAVSTACYVQNRVYPQSSEDVVADDAGKKTNEEPANEGERNGYANSTNGDSTVSAVGQCFTNADDLPTDPLILDLEDTGIFSGAYDDEDVGVEADLNNLETTMNVRTNHKDYQNCLFAYFVSQIKPKKVRQALTDLSWIEAMQDELLQFRLQKVWRLVDLPKGKHAIGTKWVYRNKKDKREIVVRNKARLVAQDKGDILLVQVYLDDIIFGSTKKSLCTEFESLIDKKFQMSSMGELTFFLGLQVMERDDEIFISQDKYVADILKKFDFVIIKTASTPIKTNKALLKDKEVEDVDVHLYRSMIGSLMYLTASRCGDRLSSSRICFTDNINMQRNNKEQYIIKQGFITIRFLQAPILDDQL
ncbi:putative ribonuclease H-like domain-containing protein [Tanacetum coccineum]